MKIYMIPALITVASYATAMACCALVRRDIEKGCVGNGKERRKVAIKKGILQILTRSARIIFIGLWPHLLKCEEEGWVRFPGCCLRVPSPLCYCLHCCCCCWEGL